MRFPLLPEVAKGETADIYFHRTRQILEAEGVDPNVKIRIFCRKDGILCGVDEVLQFLDDISFCGKVYSRKDGGLLKYETTVMEIECKYSEFCIYETAILGILAFGTGKATAARELVDAANDIPVFSFGARHNHPNVAAQLDYAAQIGGCMGCSTTVGAALFGRKSSGTSPHAYYLILGDTVKGAQLFDKYIEPDVPRIVLVDSHMDELNQTIQLMQNIEIDGVRLDTVQSRGGVRPELVQEIKQKCYHLFRKTPKIFVSGGLNPNRINEFRNFIWKPDSFGVGEYISNAPNVSFTADLYEVNDKPVNKMGRYYFQEPRYSNMLSLLYEN